MLPDQPDCGLKVEDKTQIDFTKQEAYLREIIDNNRKMIHKFEQEIQELKCQPSIKMMFSIRDCLIDHFTVACSVTWPLNGSEAEGDLALIETSLVFSCKCT